MVISKLDYPLCHISFMLEKQTDQRRSAKVGGPCSPCDQLHFHCRMFNDSGGGGRVNIQTEWGGHRLAARRKGTSVSAGSSPGREEVGTAHPPLSGDLAHP